MHTVAASTQALDGSFPAFWAVDPPPAAVPNVSEVHVYPGIVFIEKAGPDRELPRKRPPAGTW
jgi:hypothetical protein